MAKTLTLDETKAANQKLIRAFESMLKKNSFKPNQLVRWKEGLKNKALPEYNQPAMVWEILPEPLFHNPKAHVAESPCFHEPLDIVLTVMDEDKFILLHYDSRRFEPIPQ
jgi:hypothetical protein